MNFTVFFRTQCHEYFNVGFMTEHIHFNQKFIINFFRHKVIKATPSNELPLTQTCKNITPTSSQMQSSLIKMDLKNSSFTKLKLIKLCLEWKNNER